jgi:hypothetical protein
MSELNFAHEGLSLPLTADACRTRLVSLQAEVASIRLQIATTDIRRQTEKKALDASAFHRAKTPSRSAASMYSARADDKVDLALPRGTSI